MLPREIISFLSVALLSTQRVTVRAAPQLTTAIPLGVADNANDANGEGVLSGVILGSGADGTTFVLTPPVTGSNDIPITATIVENASGLTAKFVASRDSFVLTQSLGCGLNSGSAECTMEVIQVSGSLTASQVMTTSGVPAFATVVVSTSDVSGSGSGSGSAPAFPTDSPRASGSAKISVDRIASLFIPFFMVIAMMM